MEKTKDVVTPRTNIHAHFFTADHVPPQQLYYQIRDILGEKLAGGLEKVDTLHRGPKWGLVVGASAVARLFRGVGQKYVDGFVRLVRTVSLLDESDLRFILGVSDPRLRLHHVLTFVINRVRRPKPEHRDVSPVSAAIVDLVHGIYSRHRQIGRKTGKVRTQAEVHESYLRCIGSRTAIRQVVGLSMNFDVAFANTYRPLLDTEPDIPFSTQAEELGELASLSGSTTLLPFLAVDPRIYSPDGTSRSGGTTLVEEVSHYKSIGYCGIKIYPPLGFLPGDSRLESVFDFCFDHRLPVLSHGGRGGAGRKGAVNSGGLAHPYYWIPVLNRLVTRVSDAPENSANGQFRLCLAHFGGGGPAKEKSESWWDEVIRLMELYQSKAELVEVYTDIALNLPPSRKEMRKYLKRLRQLFACHPILQDRLLFGCDWWMYLFMSSPLEYYNRIFDERIPSDEFPGGSAQAFADLLEANAERYLGDHYALSVSGTEQ